MRLQRSMAGTSISDVGDVLQTAHTTTVSAHTRADRYTIRTVRPAIDCIGGRSRLQNG